MSQKTKINIKERFSDGEIDLSMSDLVDVPVKDIAALKKTFSLDLSNNRLTVLPNNFPTLTFLTFLDLSKNELTELPEDFGKLSKLKHLDLYRNNLEKLPLSFSQLTALRFLDLKDNPLVPAIAKVAGLCIDTKGCQQCAKDIVKFYQRLQQQVDSEVEMRQKARQKQLELNHHKKLEDKKKVKKEKQQNKPKKEQQPQPAKEPTSGINNLTKKKHKKEPKKTKQCQNRSSFFVWMAILLALISGAVLWLCFALMPSEMGVSKINYLYETLLEKLPTDCRSYGEGFKNYVVLLQDHTRNISRPYLQYDFKGNLFQKFYEYINYVKKQ